MCVCVRGGGRRLYPEGKKTLKSDVITDGVINGWCSKVRD